MKSQEKLIHGTIITGTDLDAIEGYLVLKGNRITEIAEESGAVDFEASGIVIPGLINAHTHLGDSFVKDLEYLPLDDLVKPPDGLKHKHLKNASREVIMEGIMGSLHDMMSSGTTAFADFRENGRSGVEIMLEAISKAANTGRVPEAFVLGRCENPHEVGPLLEVAQGMGISGTQDVPLDHLESIVEAFRHLSNGEKKLAIHAGEKDSEDIEDAITLDPDFLVHMTHAAEPQIRRVGLLDMPVVVCPRSNFVTGVANSSSTPNMIELLKQGVLLGLGTDNVMLNSPDMLGEMEFLSKVFLKDDREVLKLATVNNAHILGLADYGSIEIGKSPPVVVFDPDSHNLRGITDPIRGIVRRGSSADRVGVF